MRITWQTIAVFFLYALYLTRSLEMTTLHAFVKISVEGRDAENPATRNESGRNLKSKMLE